MIWWVDGRCWTHDLLRTSFGMSGNVSFVHCFHEAADLWLPPLAGSAKRFAFEENRTGNWLSSSIEI